MKKRDLTITGALILCALFLTLFAGCTGTSSGNESQGKNGTVLPSKLPEITKVELYHFHGNQQCYSCILLGDLAEKVVKQNYSDELASGKLVFGHINAEDPDNRDVVQKYEVVSSSLMLGVYTKDSFTKQDLVGLWYRIGNEEEYARYLTGILDPFLKGEQS
ncbi:MAG TPA: nitrophenyl compound nitroreductase subunit ArsF family protein [Methanospirillum sp.]|uniref:nitrophenyl compound nitroreductase subunit ArsF family protein n=1 Tax=Methanospirillum sp. TaxID=45200 RepID=UPI002C5635F8|nr:nitrophenyl compound nitroreductase subunit ArsF family protein [Methanospirillum sp.]HOJ95366.1 nitrophenyl compound nitroreductase subunit ArsF family protein [Methanospirillum sp.]HPP76847.1 nitrophenyl compound nitroreductase subunit ArsF family protein [Methanospirillum sp.]